MFVLVLLWSGIYSGSCTGTQVMNIVPSGLSLGGIPEGYSDCTPGGIRGNGEELEVSEGCHQVYPRCIPTPLGGRTGRDEYSTCIGKGQIKSDQERKALV